MSEWNRLNILAEGWWMVEMMVQWWVRESSRSVSHRLYAVTLSSPLVGSSAAGAKATQGVGVGSAGGTAASMQWLMREVHCYCSRSPGSRH